MSRLEAKVASIDAKIADIEKQHGTFSSELDNVKKELNEARTEIKNYSTKGEATAERAQELFELEQRNDFSVSLGSGPEKCQYRPIFF
jgi:uncharacterized coiled-coil DUF342 family protein